MQNLNKFQRQILKSVNKPTFAIFLISSIFLSCQTENLSADDTKIIALLVDRMARPLPPVPKAHTNDLVSDQVMDSLHKVKLKVAIHPRIGAYKDALDKHATNRYISTLNKVKSKKGHQLFLADTIKLRESMDFKDFDLLFNFSDIIYDDSGTKARVHLGVSRSRLAGFSVFFELQKTHKEWTIASSNLGDAW